MPDMIKKDIPYGYCQCGCGQKTNIAYRNIKRLGHIKGEPLKYVRGHTSRTTPCQNTSPNPNGYCLCGCGKKTRISLDNRYGNVKGEPRQFIHGHGVKGGPTHPSWKGGIKDACSGRYRVVNLPDHPRANDGYVLEHVLIAEKALGKPLPEGAEVHHINSKGKDNRNINLVICENHAYHHLLHTRQKAFIACGHANWKKCWICQQWDDPNNLYKTGKSIHSQCRREYTKRLKIKHKKSQEL